MALSRSLVFQDRVLYACSCSQLAALSDLYFCRHCKVPRCQECVFSTVESFSCHHCFEACSVSIELKAKKGRCSHCFQCPRCSSTLTTRSIIVPSDVLTQRERSGPKDPLLSSSTTQAPSKAGVSVNSPLKSPGGTKVYFLSCSHCKWSTRDVSLKDKRSPADFKDKISVFQARVSELVLFYKEYAIQDVAEHDKVKKPFATRRPRTFGSLLDPTRFKLSSSSDSPISKRRSLSQQKWNSNICEKMKALPSEHLPPSDDLYSQPICLAETSSVAQRLKDPSFQPSTVSEFLPHQLFLITKKLHRCNGCDHILIKAEMNPGSIRFKIQQIAWHVFPHLCIVDNPILKVGEETVVYLSISNPVSHPITISFHQYDSNLITIKETVSPCSVPSGLFVITSNDDLGDLDDDDISDDPQFVFSRHPGKIVLKFRVTPKNVLQSVKFVFEMVFSHKPTIEADQSHEETQIKVPVLVRLLKNKEKL